MMVTHVVAGLAQAEGGPSYSVPALSAKLSALNVHARVRFVADPRRDIASFAEVNCATTAYPPDPGLASVLRGSRALRSVLNQDAHDGAILHVHGLWLMPNLYPAWIKRRLPATLLVHSPRGMLAPAALEISKWKKKPVWYLW